MAGKAAPKKNLSALKRARQAEQQRLRNKAVKSALKTVTKKVQAAAAEKKKDEVQKALTEATRAISKAATKGVIHRNTASRNISRLTKLTNTALRPEGA